MTCFACANPPAWQAQAPQMSPSCLIHLFLPLPSWCTLQPKLCNCKTSGSWWAGVPSSGSVEQVHLFTFDLKLRRARGFEAAQGRK